MIDGYYYLHENGSMIWKRYLDDGQVADFRESPMVRHFWPVDKHDRENAWGVCIEGLAMGADKAHIQQLCEKWGLTDADADIYARRVGCMVRLDGDLWCATRTDFTNPQEEHAGFGTDKLHAMADLAKSLGIRPSKMWGATFKSLLNKAKAIKQ